MKFVNNLLKKVNKIYIPKTLIYDSTDSVNHHFRHDFISSKHVIFLDEDFCVSYILNTNGIIYSKTIRSNNQVNDLVKAIKNKKSCARDMVIQNDYVPINSNSATFCKILRDDMCQAALGQNNQCVRMSSAALIMAFIKSPVNWVKFDINKS
uniref:Late expression factor-8 n=1 Tax=Strongyloides venezuelensis TaxID=75913 RepID=A0A0K0FS29_STRVS